MNENKGKVSDWSIWPIGREQTILVEKNRPTEQATGKRQEGGPMVPGE